MGKVKLKGKNRQDRYYNLAKEHGYRSRASWKLIQLDAKFRFLGTSRAALDLCAAPGGWTQVAVQRMPVGSFILAVDLDPIQPVRGAVSFQGDITDTKCRATIKKLTAQHGCRAFDLVLHDGSPNVGGAWATEATSQNALVIDSIRLATEFLAPKGNFVTKVFRSQDYNSVLYCLKQLFVKVEVNKPLASRSSSAEIYVLGLNYKAPSKIDPRLLDMKHLFQGPVEPKKVLDVLRGTKQKRNRDGYEDGKSIVKEVYSAKDFIWSASPVEVLGSVTSISFEDPDSLIIKDHDLTTEEVKILCDDLRVLGKQDFKHLLKWRMRIRKALSLTQKTDSSAKDVENDIKVDEEDAKILNEMEELTDVMARKKKREKKLLEKRQAKDKARKATGMQVDALEDGYTDQELFALSSIKSKKDLVAFDSSELGDDDGIAVDSGSEEIEEESEDHAASDMDSDEERRRYDEKMDEYLDKAYEHFVTKKEGSSKQRKRAKKSYEDDQLLESGGNVDIINSDHDSDNDMVDHEANPLLAPLVEEEVQTQAEITEKWFSQDIFAKAVEEGDLGKFDSEDEMQVDRQVEEPSDAKKEKEKSSEIRKLHKDQLSEADGGFEIVPAPATDSSSDDSSSDELEDLDVDAKAEILACAKKMLRKKQREDMLDDAYNKNLFDDQGLPRWFAEEEKRHRQPMKPVTKEEIAAMKAQFKEIDTRPAKKVAQARERKKRAAMRKREKVLKKANAISEQADISDRSKGKQIDKLFKKAEPQRPKKEYVVAKKGVQVRAGKGKVLVDPRMKKDSRSRGSGNKQRKGSSKKGKNAKGKKDRGSASKGSKGGFKGNKGRK